MEEEPNTKVHRVRSAPYFRGKAGRALSYATFFFACFWKGLRIPRVDVVVTMTTPPMLSLVGATLQKFRGARHFIWVMDLFPEALVDVGIAPANSLSIRLLHWISDWAFASASGTIAIGECMRRRLIARNLDAAKLHVAENWANGEEIFPIQRRREGPLVVMYSGNLGLSHDIDTVLFAMRKLKDDPRFQFRFVGGGQRQIQIQEQCIKECLQNAVFLPYCTRSKLAKSLSEADIGLVTQRVASAGSVVPSKVYGLMAAGRPILYIGPEAATPNWIIDSYRCGWQVDCGDGPGLVKLLEELYTNEELILSAGARAREAFLQRYDQPQGVARICSLVGVVSAAPAGVHEKVA
jgi:putative colanic acid biosynthesis glycosyltransferase WcaI